MPVSLALLMAVMAALLTLSVCAVRWRAKDDRPSAERPRTEDGLDATPVEASHGIPAYAPPEGSLLAAQLEVGQTFYIQTRSAKYALTLRDPVLGEYEAVRVGLKRGGGAAEERFTMLFKGTFVPGEGLRFGAFVLGGNLCYKKVRDGGTLDMSPSSPVIRVFFCIPEDRRQAS